MTAADRASAAAAAVIDRHLHRLLGMPGTRLAAIAWPTGRFPGHLGRWHYWWQAHFVDLLVDHAIHRDLGAGSRYASSLRSSATRPAKGSSSATAPAERGSSTTRPAEGSSSATGPADRSSSAAAPAETGSSTSASAYTVDRLLRGIRLRNLGRWTNDYYDDMAWLGLAIERADRHLHLDHHCALRTLTGRMLDAWVPQHGGGIPWRTTDLFFNAPANGPAAILLARTGHVERASAMADWMDRTLIADDSHLVIDGVKPGPSGELTPVTDIYTYCQGVVLGTEVELMRRTGSAVHADRLDRLLRAVETRLCDHGVIPGAGGGDGGLFAGILARYLALIVTDVPSFDGADDLRTRAATIVTASADAVWNHRLDTEYGPIFGPDWRRPATKPTESGRKAQFRGGAVSSSQIPECDLSVQLSAWMALEAALAVDLRLREHDETDAP